MRDEALRAGVYKSPGWNRDFPKIQILTIADLLREAEIRMPPQVATFKKAQRVRTVEEEQGMMELTPNPLPGE